MVFRNGYQSCNPAVINKRLAINNRRSCPGIYHSDFLKLNHCSLQFMTFLNPARPVLAFRVKPEHTGRIDFKKTAVSFSCDNCSENGIFNQDQVSAFDIAKAHLPNHIFDIILYP